MVAKLSMKIVCDFGLKLDADSEVKEYWQRSNALMQPFSQLHGLNILLSSSTSNMTLGLDDHATNMWQRYKFISTK